MLVQVFWYRDWVLKFIGFWVWIMQIICNRDTGESRGFAFVTMNTVEEAEKALEMFHKYVSLLWWNLSYVLSYSYDSYIVSNFLGWNLDEECFVLRMTELGKVVEDCRFNLIVLKFILMLIAFEIEWFGGRKRDSYMCEVSGETAA